MKWAGVACPMHLLACANRAGFALRFERVQAFYSEAMLISEQNMEIVRGGLEAAFRRPKPDFAKINALYDPAHELISRRDALEGGSRRGARGYRDWLLDSAELLPWQSRLEEVTEIDDDRVLAVIPTRNTGTSSGVVVDQQLTMVVTVRGGKIIRTEVFGSRVEALKAVGLAE